MSETKSVETNPVERIVSRMNADECHWHSIEDYIQSGMLQFCGCGHPEDNLKYISEGLAHINDLLPDRVDDSEWYDGWVKRGHEVFGNEESRCFFFYWTDKEGLTEHGGSVPGWLTAEGKELLGALQEIEKRGNLDGQL